MSPVSPPKPATALRLALSKGRILEEVMPLLQRMGIEADEDPRRSRRLILGTSRPDLEFVILRAADVPTYVDYGAADLGVAGKDVLMEHPGDGLYEPLDLGIARCRLVVAGPPDLPERPRRLRVATKYLNTTRRYFAARGVQVEVIKLYGSMELAPIAGLSDLIVDLVDTGNTLRANGLVARETIAEISSRLVVNKAAMKLKGDAVKALVGQFAALVADRGP